MLQAFLYASRFNTKGEIDRNIFGSFVEHLGRTIYSGIYEPSHPLADEDGFRLDIIRAVEELGVTNIRYPGGNFVSCYNWQDGVGEKKDRKTKLDIAWNAVETNEFGLNEFMRYARKTQVMPIMSVNLGTRGIEDAMEIVEYCNYPEGTYLSDLRRKHGFEQPHSIKTWCLGNEMDGPWQIGHKTADEYGRLAAECAKAMKRIDPEIKLVVCGSSLSSMSTYPQWELTTLEHTYEYVDYISLHQYFGGQEEGTYEFLSQSVNMENYIRTVCAVCDVIQAKKRSNKQMLISFDEWGVWSSNTIDEDVNEESWRIAPRFSEMIYSYEDTLLFASMLMALLKNCDRVKIACQSLLTNVSATIMTERGGEYWLQPTYYPFSHMAKLARGKVLDIQLDCPGYSSKNGEVPFLDIVAVQSDISRDLTIFAVNRNLTEDIQLHVEIQGIYLCMFEQHILMKSEDIKATNYDKHDNIVSETIDVGAKLMGSCILTMDKFSWNVFRLKYTE